MNTPYASKRDVAACEQLAFLHHRPSGDTVKPRGHFALAFHSAGVSATQTSKLAIKGRIMNFREARRKERGADTPPPVSQRFLTCLEEGTSCDRGCLRAFLLFVFFFPKIIIACIQHPPRPTRACRQRLARIAGTTAVA